MDREPEKKCIKQGQSMTTRPATEALWSRLSLSFEHQSQPSATDTSAADDSLLSTAASDSGFLPLRLSQRQLTQRDRPLADQLGALLASLSVFGCLADGRCPDGGAGSDLACRELQLIRLGATKLGVNTLLRALREAENVGRPVCLVLHPWQRSPRRLALADLAGALRSAWPPGSNRCCYRAAVFLVPEDAGAGPVRVETAEDVGGEAAAAEIDVNAVLIAFEATFSATRGQA